MNAKQIITRSLRMIGVVKHGEEPGAPQLTDSLETLNTMIKAWQAERLMISVQTLESFPLVVAQGDYSIGVGGDFNTARPMNLLSSFVRDTNGLDYPIEVFTRGEYYRICNKTAPGRPTALYYDPLPTLGYVRLNPVPLEVETIFLDSTKPLTTFTALNTSSAFAEEMSETIIFNLAVRLSPEFELEPSAYLYSEAERTKRIIKAFNWEPEIMRMDAALLHPNYNDASLDLLRRG